MLSKAIKIGLKLALTGGIMAMSCPSAAMAGPYYDQLMRDFGLNKADHSFCFEDSSGELQGDNIYKKVRLASTSKLVTTLWAMDLLGPEWQFETKFFLKGDHLHIEGSLDPVFSKRKLFYFVSQLLNKNIKHISKVTFNQDFRAFAAAEDYVGSVVVIDANRSARNLYDYWHTPAYNKLKPVYRAFINETPESVIEELQIRRNLEELDLSIGSVEGVERAPFDLADPLVSEFHHFSPEIKKYLKFMNIESNNFIADQVFEKLGGEKAFDLWLEGYLGERLKEHDLKREGYNANELSMKMYTGSGLDTKRAGERVDNYSSCALMTTLLKDLRSELDQKGNHLKEVVAVPGSDGGTFRTRLRGALTKNTLVAKTGTLFHTSSLTGVIYSKGHTHPFGIFHQLTGGKGNARIVQNKLVEKLVEDFGGPERFDYSVEYFFPASAPLE